MKKFLAVIKYLFFPFLMTQAASNYNQFTGGEKINALVETEQTTWLATNQGLWKVNNRTGKAICLTTQNSQLPANTVNDVCITADGNIYAATDKGILRYDGYAYMVISSQNSNLPNTKITSIACDKSNNLWVGTEGHGLVIMRQSKCRFFNTKNSVLTDNNIDSIMTGNDGTVFILLKNQDLVKITNESMILLAEPEKENNTIAQTN